MKIAYIITGTSRGLGKSLQNMIIKNNNDIFPFNRKIINNKNFSNYLIDLNDAKLLEKMLNNDFKKTFFKYDLIVFISNAAILKPSSVNNLSLENIQSSVNINYVAPILILKFLLNLNKNILVMNITSGAKDSKNKGLSLYSSLKLAYYHLLEISNLESKRLNVIHYDPGAMDTDMQKILRVKGGDFDRHEQFTQMYKNNNLKNVDDVSSDVFKVITKYIEENY